MSEFIRRVSRLARPVASRLGQLDIELTERCNKDCIHCCINVAADDAAAQAREMTWTEHGALDTPVEYLCAVAHEQARYLRWLGASENG